MTAVFEENEPSIKLLFHAEKDFKDAFVIVHATLFSTVRWTLLATEADALMAAVEFLFARLLARISVADLVALARAHRVFALVLARLNASMTGLATILWAL